MKLWHYTCDHGRAALGDTGTLISAAAQLDHMPQLPADALPLLWLIWATDQEEPDARALGLTRNTIGCDRTRHRYSVPADSFRRWGRIRSRLPTALVDALELADGAQPSSWYVSLDPVPMAQRDPFYRRE